MPWLIPALVTLFWLAWALSQVNRYEAGIAARTPLAYAVFVQLSHAWGEGWGWVQTVHKGYFRTWYWGGHYGVIWLATASLATLFDSPWTLARIQVIGVGLGCMSAWLLGWAEGKLPGGLAGLVLYAGSGGVVFLAVDDYQDLTLCLPLIPLAVWAARHASPWAFVVAVAALASVREELWLMLPLVGLSASKRRALLGAAVALAWVLVLAWFAPVLDKPPVLFRLETMTGRPLLPVLDPRDLNLSGYDLALGGAFPWFLLQPACAFAALGAILFHAQPSLVGGLTFGLNFSHHYAPITGFGIAGAIVVLGRLSTKGRRWAAAALVLALLSTSSALVRDWPALVQQVERTTERYHPIWNLLPLVPPDAVLYVPARWSPAAARRRWLANEENMPAAPGVISYAIVPVQWGVTGETLAIDRGWTLLARPTGLPRSPAEAQQRGY